MKHTDLTTTEIETLNEYARTYQEHKAIEEKLKDLRKSVDKIIETVKADDLEEVILETDAFMVPFAVKSESLKFNYDITKYIEETQAYNTLSVSLTEARKRLTHDQLATYFETIIGSRKLGKIIVK